MTAKIYSTKSYLDLLNAKRSCAKAGWILSVLPNHMKRIMQVMRKWPGHGSPAPNSQPAH